MKKLIYFSIISSMIGASVISISIGAFQLSLFRGIVILMLLISLLKLLSGKKLYVVKNKGNEFSIKVMFIWLLYAFFSLAWVKDYVGWLKAVFFIGIGFITILIFKEYIRDKNDILRSFHMIIPMIIFHNILGWYEVTTGHFFFLSENKISKYLRYGNPVSTFGNTNDFAVFLMFAFYILYICLMNTDKIINKTIYMLTMCSSVGLILFTMSRASLIGLILGFFVLTIYSLRKEKTRKFILIILCSILLLLIFNANIIFNFLNNISNILVFDFLKQQGSEFVRINLIKNGFNFLVSTLGFGTGAGNIEYWMSHYGEYYTGVVYNIHNWWMEILVGYGLIVFTLYILFYLKLFMDMKKKYKLSNNPTDMSMSLGIMCILVGYIVASLSSSSNINAEWLWVFWAIVIVYQGMEIDNA